MKFFLVSLMSFCFYIVGMFFVFLGGILIPAGMGLKGRESDTSDALVIGSSYLIVGLIFVALTLYLIKLTFSNNILLKRLLLGIIILVFLIGCFMKVPSFQ